MREIKFRGITFKGDFVYGDLSNDRSGGLSFNEKQWVRNNLTENSIKDDLTAYWQQTTKRISWREGYAYCNAPVKPETVGQFTGLKDKNGKGVYEGDIVLHAKESNMTSKCTMIGPYAIGWNGFESHFELIGAPIHGRLIYKAYEIIGNIHEDPELLELDK